MTEPTDTETEPTTDALPQVGQLPDVLLQWFAKQAQSGVLATLKMTISVSGQLITGSVIGRDAWFDAHVEKAGDDGTRAFLADIASAMRRDDEADDTAETYAYLHLTDASYAVGQGLSQGSAMIRIRIDSIDSWAIGGATMN